MEDFETDCCCRARRFSTNNAEARAEIEQMTAKKGSNPGATMAQTIDTIAAINANDFTMTMCGTLVNGGVRLRLPVSYHLASSFRDLPVVPVRLIGADSGY